MLVGFILTTTQYMRLGSDLSRMPTRGPPSVMALPAGRLRWKPSKLSDCAPLELCSEKPTVVLFHPP